MLMVTCDHFAPPARIDWANLQRDVLAFVRRHGVPDLRMYQGICHQLLLEDPRLLPGTVTVGADSHTLLAGAVGGFATGLGATDILAILATGETWFQVPASVQVVLTGTRKPWVMGRDVAFHLLRHFGEDGAAYRALELWDDTGDGLSMDARAAITCMATEMGAKAALFAPDAVTVEYLRLRDGKAPGTDTAPRVAEWVDHFGGGSVDEAVLYARHFLLKPKELVGDIESKLDAAKAKGGEDLQATADAEDEALEGMAPLDQDEACGCDDEGCACEDDEVDRK